MGEPFDPFQKLWGALIRPTTLRKCLKFDLILFKRYRELLLRNRASVIYPEIFGTPCRKNYALDRKLAAAFLSGFDVLYHLARFGEDRTTRAGCRCENVVFVCFFCLFVTLPVRCSFEETI